MEPVLKTILLVEDDINISIAEECMLKEGGYKVIKAVNGEEAVEVFKTNNNIDLILMDIDLGEGMDGTQAAEIILLDHKIPLIFLSSHTETEVIEKTDKITSYGFVVKGSSDNVLYAAIKMAFKLSIANDDIRNKSQSLIDSELRYRRLFEAAKDGIFILNSDSGAIIDINPYLLELTGYSYDELVGKFLWEISPFKDIAENKKKFKELKKLTYVHYEHLPLLNKNGVIVDVEFVSNVYSVGDCSVIQCNIRDIKKRKELEDSRQAEMNNMDVLQHELQHRITNSLAIIISLISIESSRSSVPEVTRALLNIENRVHSIADLYGMLKGSENLKTIRLDSYIRQTATTLMASYAKKKRTLEFQLDDVKVDFSIAISIGLILNELMTNTLKYAFPGDRKGSVRILLECKKDNVLLEFSDNGIGLHPEFDINKSKGLGMILVNLLSEQIKGSFKNVPSKKGVLFRIEFKSFQGNAH